MRRRRFRPSSWPVRWRLALASAGLTLAILLVFAGVIGHLAGERVRDDFSRDLNSSASGIASRTVIFIANGVYVYRGPNLDSVAAANGAHVKVFALDGTLLKQSDDAPDLGPVGGRSVPNSPLRVATAAIINGDRQTVGYVQYARSEEYINSTIARIWLFIAAGVLGGTLLASLAGLAIADRAMRPVGALTSRARQIASTRDPSLRMPDPVSADEVGELTRVLGEMLRSLEAAQSEREDAMHRQREFIADASHELRTPLTSVLANLELLQESLSGDTGDDIEMVESALRSSRRMSRLVADLLILARADAGRFSPRAPCDLSEIARDAAVELTPVLGNRRLVVGDLPVAMIDGNRDELHRLIVNLLDNSIHHTPDGSRIGIEARCDKGSGEVLLEISDDGPGIPAQMREQIFERFARAGGSADTAHGNGTGLGLAIVRSVAEAHGGSVSAGESSGGGAKFSVKLPALPTIHEVEAKF